MCALDRDADSNDNAIYLFMPFLIELNMIHNMEMPTHINIHAD